MMYKEVLETKSGSAVTVEEDADFSDYLYLSIGDISFGAKIASIDEKHWEFLERIKVLKDLERIAQAIKIIVEALVPE